MFVETKQATGINFTTEKLLLSFLITHFNIFWFILLCYHQYVAHRLNYITVLCSPAYQRTTTQGNTTFIKCTEIKSISVKRKILLYLCSGYE